MNENIYNALQALHQQLHDCCLGLQTKKDCKECNAAALGLAAIETAGFQEMSDSIHNSFFGEEDATGQN